MAKRKPQVAVIPGAARRFRFDDDDTAPPTPVHRPKQDRNPTPKQDRKNSRELVWVTKDRQEVPISKMGGRHLINCIFFLRRKTRAFTTSLCANKKTAEKSAKALLDMDTYYAAMMLEARKRGIGPLVKE